MKKYLALAMVLVLAFCLAACGCSAVPETSAPETDPSQETTMPTTVPASLMQVGNVDLTGMSREEALAAVQEAAAAYELTLTVNGKKLTIPSAELALAVDEAALEKFLESQGGADAPAAVMTFDREALCKLLQSGLNTAPENAVVTYDTAKKQFVAAKGTEGTEYDINAAADTAGVAIGLLAPSAEAEVKTTAVAPEIPADGEKVKAALNTANGYLKVSLTYTFSPEGGSTAKETLSADTLAGFVSISDSLEVSISKSAVEEYAADLGSRHNGGDYKGKFVTTGGRTLGYTVTYYGQKVNQSALADDIYQCVTGGTSGTRTAPYSAKSDKPYGGSYVEVDLSSQHLWLYKNGERVVSTDLVSGCVAKEYYTPNGIYSIYAKKTDTYLTGEDYRTFVSYWMPFYGGYGLHDATWRWSFGGTIYYYDGSHGCVNLPASAAKKIYNNVSVGTKVILYGGKTEVPDLEQKITGTTSYTVEANAAPFKLDAELKYSGAEVTYASSDTSVVTVSANGTVTVKGPGTATITVKAAPFDYYTGAELKVTITVKNGETTPTEPSNPTQPTEPPTEPTQPTEPPTEPTQPTEPPTEPTQPTEPPTEPTQPTEPPTEPTTPPTDPTEPSAETEA